MVSRLLPDISWITEGREGRVGGKEVLRAYIGDPPGECPEGLEEESCGWYEDPESPTRGSYNATKMVAEPGNAPRRSGQAPEDQPADSEVKDPEIPEDRVTEISSKIDLLNNRVHDMENRLSLKMDRVELMISRFLTVVTSKQCAKADVRLDEPTLRILENQEGKMEEDEDHEVDMEVAVREKRFVRGTVKDWFTDRGFGFIRLGGREVFCHLNQVMG